LTFVIFETNSNFQFKVNKVNKHIFPTKVGIMLVDTTSNVAKASIPKTPDPLKPLDMNLQR